MSDLPPKTTTFFGEKISVTNFLSLTQLELVIKRFNLVIGEQAQGKSLLLKLIYFCRHQLAQAIARDQESAVFSADFTQQFSQFFQLDLTELSSDWEINYQNGSCQLYFDQRGLQVLPTVTTTRELASHLVYPLTEHIFVPALRQGFGLFQPDLLAQFQPTSAAYFSYLTKLINKIKPSSDSSLNFSDLPVPAEITQLSQQLLTGQLVFDSPAKTIKLQTLDQKTIELAQASSAQQSLWSILLIIQFIAQRPNDSVSLFIEEPELNLYPTRQEYFLQELLTSFTTGLSQIFLTTHSPYLLNLINNYLYAAQIRPQLSPDNQVQLDQLVPPVYQLQPEQVSLIQLVDGRAQNLLDINSGLLITDGFDQTADQLSQQFQALLDLELPYL